MAIGDIQFLEQNTYAGRGGRVYNVAASTAVIYPGEPVARSLGGTVVTAALTNTPSVGTDYYAGVALTQSTNTASAAGTVVVAPTNSSVTLTIAPSSSAAYDTQAEYDALVGKRVLLTLTSGTYTILATDSANNGCIIMPLDIAKYPGKVAFAFRQAISDVQ